MTESRDLAQARVRAADARERLSETLGELQSRLEPTNVIREAVDGLAETGKRHPGKIAGGIALIAAFLARRKIGALIDRATETDDEPAQPAQARRVRSQRPRPAPAKRKTG